MPQAVGAEHGVQWKQLTPMREEVSAQCRPMAHPQQIAYFERVRNFFADAFANAQNILEVGSQNINGTVRDFFAPDVNYLGIDLGLAIDVDLVIPGELIELPDRWADVSISTECFEHAENWKEILLNMIRITKPEGLILLTFAGKGRPVHGTLDSDLFSSPFTTSYYQNLGPDDIAREIAIGKYFTKHAFEVDSIAHDTYFWGIRNSDDPVDPASDWESLERRLVRAQGQLSQAVNIYNELKLELEKSRSAHDQTRKELTETQKKYNALLDQTAAELAETQLNYKAALGQTAAELAETQKKYNALLDQTAAELAETQLNYKAALDQTAAELAETKLNYKAALDQFAAERQQAVMRLHASDQERLVLEQERNQAKTAFENISQQVASAQQEAAKARQQSHENWLITMEIVNSRLWRGTHSIRKIKDALGQRLAPIPKPTHQPNLLVSEPTSDSAALTDETETIHQSDYYQWLEARFEQDWKSNQDLIRKSVKTNYNPTKTGLNALVIDWKCPEADKDSGSHRMEAIIRIMLDLGIKISFISHAVHQEAHYINSLGNMGVSVYIGIDSAIKHLAEEGQAYEYVMLVRPDTAEAFLPFIQLYCPTAKLIYDTVDLHYLRMRRALRLLSTDSEAEKNTLLAASEEYYAKEMIISRSSDKVVVVSDEEKKFLADEDSKLDIVTIPNIHVIAENTPGFHERKDLLFIGGFDHQPNKDAMIYFCKDVLPKIAEILEDISITIVGSNMPDEISALESKHVKAVGYVEDLEPILASARIFVAPLRYGAGMKGKVGISMAHGLPVVGTSIAAEGFGLTDGKQMLITDNPSQLAEYTVKLYCDQDLWIKLSMQGKTFIRDNFSPVLIKERIATLFDLTAYATNERSNG
jgi:glycosyltransferase involved in cell wall biosynthesis/SAM-dependent methyltransferase